MKIKSEIEIVYDVVSGEDGFLVQRNGRALMTPSGTPFALPKEKMATDICAEWKAQGDKIVPDTMPITQLAATCFDIVGKDPQKTIEGLLAYIDSELLCHRAESPDTLAASQQEQWQPLLDWSDKHFGIHWQVGCGVMPVRQKEETHEILRVFLEKADPYYLTGLSCAVDAAGSLVLGLALAEGEKTATEIFSLSELDVSFQEETWGKDEETEIRQKAMLKDLEACERWFSFLKW